MCVYYPQASHLSHRSVHLAVMSTSKETERFSLFGDERKEMTEAEEAYRLHSTAMNPDFRLQPHIGA